MRNESDAAMEMTRLWKSQNDFHSRLEISPRTRDSHIPTADHRCVRSEERRMNRPSSGPLSERPTGLVSERRNQASNDHSPRARSWPRGDRSREYPASNVPVPAFGGSVSLGQLAEFRDRRRRDRGRAVGPSRFGSSQNLDTACRVRPRSVLSRTWSPGFRSWYSRRHSPTRNSGGSRRNACNETRGLEAL